MLQQLKIVVEIDQSTEVLEALNQVESRVRLYNMEEIICLRQHSRVKWLKWGDVRTKYFFNQQRAKQARESI